MKLLKELSQISEGALKKELHAAIDMAIGNAKKFAGPPYDEYIHVIAAIADEVKKNNPKLAASITADDLTKAIRYDFDEERWEELNGTPVKEDDQDHPANQQRLIKSAGQYKLVASGDGERMFLYDTAGKLIVEMPVVIWKQLTGAI
jgi:hypothetical protein